MKNIVEFSGRKKALDEASAWLVRLDSDEGINDSERAELYDWLDQSPAHREHLEQLSKVWRDANILTKLAVPLPETRSFFERLTSFNSFKAIAATLILSFAVIIGAKLYTNEPTQRNGQIVTKIGDQKTINLADGSILKLNTNSRVRIEYNKDFRNIYLLSGEAHFSVAKNKDRPFRVYAGKGRIHAIGTAFSVHVLDDKVDVTVSEGRVGVSAFNLKLVNASQDLVAKAQENSMKGLGMLRAGEVGSIISQLDEKSNEVSTLQRLDEATEVHVAKRISWTSGVLIFAGEPLEEVVKEISRYTEVNIEFADPEVKKIRIGGSFAVGETESMFSSLETSFGLQITRLNNDRVVISGTQALR